MSHTKLILGMTRLNFTSGADTLSSFNVAGKDFIERLLKVILSRDISSAFHSLKAFLLSVLQ